MTKIFLLNGPPRSGKDTGAHHLAEYFSGKVMKFATPLKLGAAALYLNGDNELFASLDTSEEKDKNDERFFGLSCRQVQINLSESFLKVFHGKDVFGNILANNIEAQRTTQGDEVIFVSDSGFREEAEVLVRKFGSENVFLIRVHREGYTYQGDSRSYIELDDLGVRSYDVHNPNGEVDSFYSRLREIVAYGIGETK